MDRERVLSNFEDRRNGLSFAEIGRKEDRGGQAIQLRLTKAWRAGDLPFEALDLIVPPQRRQDMIEQRREREARDPEWSAFKKAISSKAANLLVNHDLNSFDALCQCGEMDLLRLDGCGRKTIREIIDALAASGRSLAGLRSAEARGPGRPPLPQKDRKLASVAFRPTPSMRDRLETAASANERSLTAEIEARLEHSFLVEDFRAAVREEAKACLEAMLGPSERRACQQCGFEFEVGGLTGQRTDRRFCSNACRTAAWRDRNAARG